MSEDINNQGKRASEPGVDKVQILIRLAFYGLMSSLMIISPLVVLVIGGLFFFGTMHATFS